MTILTLLACGVEPMNLPADPSQPGVPVGTVRVEAQGQVFEVFYPATGEEPASAQRDLEEFVPGSVSEVLGEGLLPALDVAAAVEAPPRRMEGPVPVLFFSHGFGGFRLQSVDLAAHLASRGYVVVAVDHPGRMLGDIVPCMFSPPLDGCGIEVDDPGPDDVEDALAWLDALAAGEAEGLPESLSEGLAAQMDPTRLGLFGHSAGAGTTVSLGQSEERFTALLPMAGAALVEREVPTAVLAGSCDAFALDTEVRESAAQGPTTELYMLKGAGHLAFSDLCELGLGEIADELGQRDDISATWLAQLRALATDGCPGEAPVIEHPDCPDAYLDLALSQEIVRHAATVFFDEALRGEGAGISADAYAEAELSP